GYQHERLATKANGFGDAGQIDLGLATASDAIEQERGERTHASAYGIHCCALFVIQNGCGDGLGGNRQGLQPAVLQPATVLQGACRAAPTGQALVEITNRQRSASEQFKQRTDARGACRTCRGQSFAALRRQGNGGDSTRWQLTATAQQARQGRIEHLAN